MIAYALAALLVLALAAVVERGVRLWTLLREMNAAVNSYNPMEM